MPAFTKGKWEITGEKKRHLGYITCNISSWVYDDEGGSQIEIATVDGTNNAETRANARLIAAAPDMYWLLKSVVDFDHTAFKFDTDGNLVLTREKYDEFRDLLARIDGTEATAMKQTLKPCPFCGGRVKIFYNNDKEHTCYIECGCCFVRTDNYYDKKYLVEDWNRRYTIK